MIIYISVNQEKLKLRQLRPVFYKVYQIVSRCIAPISPIGYT